MIDTKLCFDDIYQAVDVSSIHDSVRLNSRFLHCLPGATAHGYQLAILKRNVVVPKELQGAADTGGSEEHNRFHSLEFEGVPHLIDEIRMRPTLVHFAGIHPESLGDQTEAQCLTHAIAAGHEQWQIPLGSKRLHDQIAQIVCIHGMIAQSRKILECYPGGAVRVLA